jgi:hypothetical protein
MWYSFSLTFNFYDWLSILGDDQWHGEGFWSLKMLRRLQDLEKEWPRCYRKKETKCDRVEKKSCVISS